MVFEIINIELEFVHVAPESRRQKLYNGLRSALWFLIEFAMTMTLEQVSDPKTKCCKDSYYPKRFALTSNGINCQD